MALITPVLITSFDEGPVTSQNDGVAKGGQNFLSTNVWWEGSTDSVNASNGLARTGSYGMQCDTGQGDGVNISAQIQGNIVTFGFAFQYQSSLPGSDQILWGGANGGGGGVQHYVYFESTDSKMHWWASSTDRFSVNKVLSANTWYLCILEVNSTADTHTMKLTIANSDGSGQVSASGSRTGTTGDAGVIDFLHLGTADVFVTGAFGNASTTTYYDDCWASVTSGDYEIAVEKKTWIVEAKRVNADGTHTFAGSPSSTNFSYGTGGFISSTSATDVNTFLDSTVELAPAGTDLIMQESTDSGYVECLFADITHGTYVPHGVWGAATVTAQSTTGNMGTQVQMGPSGTMTVLKPDTADPGTLADYYAKCLTAPGGGWTRTNVNDVRVRFGYATASSPNEYMGSPIINVLLFPGDSQFLAPIHSMSAVRW